LVEKAKFQPKGPTWDESFGPPFLLG
jgi:hypothetical protein